ncbi:MTAP family purine nucleoside phosphorylase [Agromyces sp. SYSU K20354]|uniref:MTAP family purine nucleoside phosphorylase n=1 Tax=Agromyces cavernae TaxID=2898659 RepID=UPI001E38F962|nr:MTAP family purine nucleoside phosphorylase [Agromyces cavernae]MCD2442041.1 MTAP family purine nucleoside phosphorylase [Agromyces cavernae]
MVDIVGVIGGTGVGELVVGGEMRDIPTPFGSVIVTVGELAGRRVAFLPRHGAGHTIAPHLINARANLWALASLGVRAVVSTAAVGSLRPGFPTESFALADQLVDRTAGRADTFFDGGLVRHLPFAEPFCPVLRSLAIDVLPDAAPRATVAVIQGPRFSTAAESRIFRESGIDLVNMSLCPEVALAAEIGIGTVTMCIVTDTDSGTSAGDPDAVTAELVFRRLAAVKPRIVAAIEGIVAAVPSRYMPRPLMDDEAVAALRALRVAR